LARLRRYAFLAVIFAIGFVGAADGLRGNISPVVSSVLLAAGRFKGRRRVASHLGGGVHVLSRIERRTQSAIRSPTPPIRGVGFSIGAVFLTETVIGMAQRFA
jgi:hypothetical protein